jgi:hypothetical protein
VLGSASPHSPLSTSAHELDSMLAMRGRWSCAEPSCVQCSRRLSELDEAYSFSPFERFVTQRRT